MSSILMNAAVMNSYGSAHVIKFEEVAIPEPKSNEVLIKVYASTATRADTMMRTGKPWFGRLILGLTKPKNKITGTGFAGKIVSVGSNVKKFKVGESVFGESTNVFSTNAQYLAISEDSVMLKKPEELSYEEAATFTDGHLTSLNFLKNVGKLEPGQKILINGASGSLGTSAVQLAKYMGAEVTGVTSSRNKGLVKSLGADYVIDYTQDNYTDWDEKYDIVYDTVGKSNFAEAKKVLKNDGIYMSPVLKLPLLIQMLFSSFFSRKKAKFQATGMKKEDELLELMQELVSIFKNGKLNTVIDRQFPLEKVAQAHAYIDTGRKKGNVIINIEH